MIETKNGSGLCMTCNNAPSCFYRATRGPSLFCEMFDDYVAPVVRTFDRESPVSSGSPVAFGATEDITAGFTGLCMNCDNRRTCRHSQRGGGVWHCEEYR